MQHCFDILAYITIDGEVVCPDCNSQSGEESNPVFACDELETDILRCPYCQSHYDTTFGGWLKND